MKKLILCLLVLCPFMLHAGIIVKQSGENIEDVTIKSITDTEILYVDPNGKETSILKNDVSAVLHDDGRYEEIKTTTSNTPIVATEPAAQTASEDINQTPAPMADYNAEEVDLTDAKVYNVYAFGVYGMVGYFAKSEYDGATVEYRVIYKSSGATEFKYLGTAPFAYVTQKAYDSPLMQTNSAFASLMSVNPLIIPNAKDVKSVEFRLSKHGYKTVVVKPIRDALLVGGLLMMLPMNKLKPEK